MPRTAHAGATYLTVAQTAELLAVSADVVRSLITAGTLPATDVAVSRGKARWRIAPADLQTFLDGQRNVKPSPQMRRKRSPTYTPKYY
jgi:excisionase family DNA binding protein